MKCTRSYLKAYPGYRRVTAALGPAKPTARRIWRDWLARFDGDRDAALGALVHAAGLDEPQRWLP